MFIYDKWNWEKKFPVVNISFTSGDFSSKKDIEEVIHEILVKNCQDLNINSTNIMHSQPGIFFEKIIREAFQQYHQKVVILIDEYDKPILDNIAKEDKSVPLQAKNILRNFYTSIKANDQYLRFVFITGVSKFSKLNPFSGLNNIQDITLHKDFATITGYTQNDLESGFTDYLEHVNLNKV